MKIFKRILWILASLFFLLVITLVLAIRWTEGRISSGQTIILDYDEDNSRWILIEDKTYDYNGLDGPYIIGDSIYRVSKDGVLTSQGITEDSIWVYSATSPADSFVVTTRDTLTVDAAIHDLPDTLLAISDIEGNWTAFVSFLQANGVIDRQFNWTFGKSHLVLPGDFVDRGQDVTAVLWLIHRLERQATKNGGQVHFLLGNHEVMNVLGQWKYARPKYHRLTRDISERLEIKHDYRLIYGTNAYLGLWLRRKNTIAQIGNYIFVHAGLSPAMLRMSPDILTINQVIQLHIDQPLYHDPGENQAANLYLGRKGPLWYRGLVSDYKYYPKCSSDSLNMILDHFKAKSIIVGHTVVDDISADYNGKVICIDVKHGSTINSGETKGLLIINDQLYAVDDRGRRRELMHGDMR